MPKHVENGTLFEGIKNADEGGDYWLARELMPLLAYVQWRQFEDVIEKAITACRNSGNDPVNHFLRTSAKNENQDGKGRPGGDYRLTRYACYLIAMNGDTRKREISFAQTYFAVQTRKQEIFEQGTNRQDLRKGVARKYTTMCKALEKARECKGKETKEHHYINEAGLVNTIALGKHTKTLKKETGSEEIRDILSNKALPLPLPLP
jgi:DNA-damage-inducible protein D